MSIRSLFSGATGVDTSLDSCTLKQWQHVIVQKKCICIAGEELFVADTPAEVHALAVAAHPEDSSFNPLLPKNALAAWVA